MILNLDKIKWRNFWLWFSDQVKRRRVIINFFITRNAWGAFSINSHINQSNGKSKVTYNSIKSAQKASEKMSLKHNTHFSYYKCLFCDGYHIGKNKDNKLNMINNNDIKIDKETGELLVKGKTKWPGPYEYYFEQETGELLVKGKTKWPGPYEYYFEQETK